MTAIDALRRLPDDVFKNMYLNATRSVKTLQKTMYGRVADEVAAKYFSDLLGHQINFHTVADRRHELRLIAWGRKPRKGNGERELFNDEPKQEAVTIDNDAAEVRKTAQGFIKAMLIGGDRSSPDELVNRCIEIAKAILRAWPDETSSN